MYAIGEEELEAVRRVFVSGKLFRYQPGGGECDAFEQEFAEKLGISHAVILSSGTNALIAALRASGIGPGDEVLIPAYTFVATAAAVLSVGAVPVVCEIDEGLGLDSSDARRRLSSRTKSVIAVHMDGLACDLKPLLSLSREKGLVLIEDVAQAMGGSYQGRHLGTWGVAGCFSLNENKNISCGEGGILVTDRRDLFERAFCIQDVSAQFNPVKKAVFQETEPFLGASMRVSEISGAIMRVQLRRLDGILAGLRERKSIFQEKLANLSCMKTVSGHCREGDCGSSLHLVFPDPQEALAFGRRARDSGVPFFPITMRPAHVCWKWAPVLRVAASEYLESVSILSRTLKLDIDPFLSLEDTRRLAEHISKLADGVTGADLGR